MGWRTAYAALRGAIGRLAALLPFRRTSRPTEAYTGRQQIRAAIRAEVARQVGHAPIPRRIRLGGKLRGGSGERRKDR